jgi:hypothetical protein
MPSVTDPAFIEFCNSRIRPSADQWYRSYLMAKDVLAQWDANGYSALPSDGTVVQDGANAGGDTRPTLTCQNVGFIIAVCQTIVTFCETPNPTAPWSSETPNVMPLTPIALIGPNGLLTQE